jgi:type II secretory pathway component PulK
MMVCASGQLRSAGRGTHVLRAGAGRRPHRQGVIFILALGTIVILSAMLLVFARNMRTEALASANRLSYVQADAIERGAEMWVLAQCEAYPGDAISITDVPAEALQIGNGWFWVLRPDPTTDQQYGFGITDEGGKLNINTATSAQLINLPGMTQDAADSTYDWRTTPLTPASTNGAKNSYYESLQEPYDAKNGQYETVEELMLVKGMTQQILYGYDLNHDGVLDPSEQNFGGMGSVVNSGTTDSRGIFNYVTCYSRAAGNGQGAPANPNGTTVVNVNSANLTQLSNTLNNTFGQSRGQEILNAISSRMPPRGGAPTWNLGAFFTASTMTASEFGQIYTQLRTTNRGPTPGVGLININTAPAQVLSCLPGLSTGDGQNLASARPNTSPGSTSSTDVSWFFNSLGQNGKVASIADAITTQSYFYSADIVAVSGDARSFKRVRIVVDGRATPAKVIYRKDLTTLGWPLPPEVRAAMRQGQPPPDATSGLPGAGAGAGNMGGAVQ